MTDTPSLPAQIEAVRDTIMAGERVRLSMKLSPLTDRNQDCLRAVLVTLQQHERLEVVAKAARDLLRYAGIKHPGADNVIVSRERAHTLENALAALDSAAAETPPDMPTSAPAERGE